MHRRDAERAWFARTLTEDRSPADAVLVVTLSAPPAPVEALFAGEARADSVLWEPHGEALSLSGRGVAVRLAPDGDGRFERLGAELKALSARTIHHVSPSAREAVSPRLLGGIAFRTGDGQGAWRGFGDADFVLPRWTYARRAQSATLSFACLRRDAGAPGFLTRALDELDACRQALANPPDPAASIAPVAKLGAPGEEPAEVRAAWRDYIREIQAAIARGTVHKVVAARCLELQLGAAPDTLALLLQLRHATTAAVTRFGFWKEGACFFGATPELLFEKRGTRVRTEALAGTAFGDRSESQLAAALAASAKDQREHAFVVRHILDALAPVCSSLRHAPSPTVRRVGNLSHLLTPIEAEVGPEADALALTARLHPTPAVGGLPLAAALELTQAHERFPRGWYCGALGWLDLDGDACFVVGIRSALVTDEGTVRIFTGAGIVAESIADAELAETRMKQAPILRALGAEPSAAGAEPSAAGAGHKPALLRQRGVDGLPQLG